MNAIETRIETKNERTPFARWNINRISSQTFSENPKIRIAGKDISLKDYQNENATDTNIYEVLEKYNGDLKLTQEQLNKKYVALNDELTSIKSLADAHEMMNEGTKLWNSLDIDTRKQFGYSVNNFVKNGGTFLNKKIKEYNDFMKARDEKIKAEQLKYEQEQKLNAGTETGTKTNTTTK